MALVEATRGGGRTVWTSDTCICTSPWRFFLGLPCHCNGSHLQHDAALVCQSKAAISRTYARRLIPLEGRGEVERRRGASTSRTSRSRALERQRQRQRGRGQPRGLAEGLLLIELDHQRRRWVCGTVAHRVREVPTYVSNVRRTHERTNEATARRVLRALALAYKAAGGAAHSIERPGSTHVVRCCSRSPCSSTQKSAFLLEKWEPAPSEREQESERGRGRGEQPRVRRRSNGSSGSGVPNNRPCSRNASSCTTNSRCRCMAGGGRASRQRAREERGEGEREATTNERRAAAERRGESEVAQPRQRLLAFAQ